MNNQRGAVLVISLIFLMLFTILGISSMQSTILEEKMAGNYRDGSRAFQAAEAVMRVGEVWLQERIARPDTSASGPGSSDVWTYGGPSTDGGIPNWWNEHADTWWSNNGIEYLAELDGVGSNPRYIAEEQTFIQDIYNVGMPGDAAGRVFYRVTARGTGARATTRSLLQSTYVRRF